MLDIELPAMKEVSKAGSEVPAEALERGFSVVWSSQRATGSEAHGISLSAARTAGARWLHSCYV